MICMPFVPPAHEPARSAAPCAPRASMSYVGTYGGLNTSRSMVRVSRGRSGETRFAVSGSIGVYWREHEYKWTI